MPESDHVTGLEPRARLQHCLERLTARGGPFALVGSDVVGLKSVNEREGFLAGDACLRRAADRLRAAAAGAEIVARLGGDELVAVFAGAGAAEAAAAAADVLAAPGSPPLRVAAVSAGADERPGPLIERLYATMRGS